MKKIVAPVIVVAGLLAGLLGGSVPAFAEPEPCDRGEFCLWPEEGHQGAIHRIAIDNTNPRECVSLPEGFDARSFANRTKRPVTVYQGRDCATEGEFDTYPGGGTFVPAAPYVVRGVQIWEN